MISSGVSFEDIAMGRSEFSPPDFVAWSSFDTPADVGTGVLVGSGEGVGGGKVGIGVLVVTKDGDDSEPDELQAIASNNRAVANMSAVRVVSTVRIPADLL